MLASSMPVPEAPASPSPDALDSSSSSQTRLLAPHLPADGNKPWWALGQGYPDTTGQFGPRWEADADVLWCPRCSLKFDWFNRRHHCRKCGRIFCSKCSSRHMLLPIEFGVREPQRCCDECATELEPQQDELQRTIANQHRVLAVESSSSMLNPVSFSLTAEIQKAAATLERVLSRGQVPLEADRKLVSWACDDETDQAQPLDMIKSSKGLAFMTVAKGGFLVSAKVGTGLVIVKRPDGTWSAPSAIGTVGIGWGAQIGGEITDFCGFLMTEEAIEAFSGQGQIALGAEMGLSVGSLGREGSASLNFAERGPCAVFSYTTSQGLFAGVSLEGAVIKSRDDVNMRFYGKEMSPAEILSTTPQPVAARALYDAIDKIFAGGDAVI